MTSVSEVINYLEKLEKDLVGTKLTNLKPFNHTYLIITRNLLKEINKGSFDDMEQVKKLIVNFAQFYFNSVGNFQNKKLVAKAWEEAFKLCEEGKSNRLMYLAICANAHINNDLAFALKKTITSEDFFSDYQKVGKVIEESIKESILSVNSDSKVLSFIDRNLFWIYKIITAYLLNQWRKMAWENYLKLMNGMKIEDQIKLTAARKAKEIRFISKFIPY